MSESNKNKKSEFESKDEAFEFLVRKSQENALKSNWKEMLDSLPDEEPLPKKKRSYSRFAQWMAVAASLILVVTSYFLFTMDHSDAYRLAEAMIHETNFIMPGDTETRGIGKEGLQPVNEEVEKKISKAMETKDYNTAVKLYASIETDGLTASSSARA